MELFLINLFKNTHSGNRTKDSWNNTSTPKPAGLFKLEQSSPHNKLEHSFESLANIKRMKNDTRNNTESSLSALY